MGKVRAECKRAPARACRREVQDDHALSSVASIAIASLPGFRPCKLSLRRSVADRASLAGSQREVRRQRDRRLPHCRVRRKGAAGDLRPASGSGIG